MASALTRGRSVPLHLSLLMPGVDSLYHSCYQHHGRVKGLEYASGSGQSGSSCCMEWVWGYSWASVRANTFIGVSGASRKEQGVQKDLEVEVPAGFQFNILM